MLTIAESLVHPVVAGKDDRALATYRRMGVFALALDAPEALDLARVRARYRVRMPDAVVLHTALREGAAVATVDRALARAAVDAGLEVVL